MMRTTQCLQDLPGFDESLQLRQPVQDLARVLDARPELPGVLVHDGDSFVTMISRRLFTDRMSRPFFLESFRYRTVERLVQLLAPKLLTLPESCSVPDALEAALARPRAEIYEPILVEGSRRRIVDLHEILIGHANELQHRVVAHEETVALVRRAEERYRSLFENSLEGIYVADDEGQLFSVNPAFAHILGFQTVGELRSTDLCLDDRVYVAAGRRTELLRRLGQVERLTGIESEIVRADGSHGWVIENLRAVHGDKGELLHVEGTMLDITERVRKERYRKAMEAAKAASRAQSEFLASISHEIRTPLHSILSFANFGSKRVDSASHEKLGRYFQQIESNGEVLLDLVNDLLDLAKFEAGAMRLQPGLFNLSLIASGMADEFRSVLAERTVEVVFHSEPARIEIEADAKRITQVLRNLLSNAVKFSPEFSRIDVLTELEHDEVRIRVRDQGPGIPENELESIFEKFHQSSRTKSDAGGTGLGLAICREIVGAHGGEILAHNLDAGGAEFSFTIPVHANGEIAQAKAVSALDRVEEHEPKAAEEHGR